MSCLTTSENLATATGSLPTISFIHSLFIFVQKDTEHTKAGKKRKKKENIYKRNTMLWSFL